MKIRAITGVCALLLASTSNAAEAGLTIYGLLDYGVNYVSNIGGETRWAGTSGLMQGSRLGFKGLEKLGPDLSALFQVENGLDLGTGQAQQGGLLFGRQAYVGLLSDTYGAVTLGRQYDSMVTFIGSRVTSPVYGGGITAHPGDIDNLNNSKRVNNAVKYMSPSFGGVTFGGLYGFGEQPGNGSRNQIWSVGAGYDNERLTLGTAYLNVRNPNQSYFTSNPTNVPGVALNNMTGSPIYSGFSSAGLYDAYGATARYSFDALKVGLVYTHINFGKLGDTSSGANPQRLSGTAKFDIGEINFTYNWTQNLISELVYSYTRGSGVGNIGGSHYNTFALSLDYYFSKRTDVYIISATQNASGTDSTGKSARATLNTQAASGSDKQTFVQIGLRHKF
ncbi:porin [Cupriavidus sp. AcVe19-6a]|uniref:porin n=1 Tax=Cupriavidus sp. AcVe19-6a TaxID=2821358 RepID=UPI001AE31C6A|nr:porin [Cupriavidus sp. AcVe19-6a]MBP0640051.1 porin [Cupriavidus sp. AcVe19-6a]